MKKRLLSAALALAMVLTMLPLGVMPAFAADEVTDSDILGNGTESVTYVAMPDANHDAKGWYVTAQKEITKDDGKKATVKKDLLVTSGVAVGSKYYSIANMNSTSMATDYKGTALTTPEGIYNVKDGSKTGLKGTTIQWIGGSGTIDAMGASPLSVDVYDGTVTITETGATNTDGTKTLKLATLNVTNNKKDNAGASAPGVTLGAGIATINDSKDTRGMKLTLSGVKSTSNISWSGANVGRSVILNNATIGTVTMSGVLSTDQTKQAGQTVTVNNKSTTLANVDNEIGDITLTGNGSKATLGDVSGTAPDVALKGTGTSLILNGTTEVGDVTLAGAEEDDITTKTTAAAPPSVTVNKGTTAASIGLIASHDADAEKSTGKYTVKAYGTVTGEIDLTGMAADIDVGNNNDGGKTGAITIGSGDVKLFGAYGEVGDVTVLKNATVTVATSAKNYTVGTLTVGAGGDPKTCTFTVPSEPSNVFDGLSANYEKATIQGGTWVNGLTTTVLVDPAFQLFLNGKWTYYGSKQLGEALTAQSLKGGTLQRVGGGRDDRTITFMNGATTFGVLYQNGAGSIILPTEVNGTKVTKWSDGKFLIDGGKDYSLPASGNVTLDAQGNLAGSDISKLTDVKVSGATAPITAQLSGTVISLSGAVTAGQHQFELTFETDAVTKSGDDEVPVTLTVKVDYNSSTGKLTFANTSTTDLGNGVMQEGFDAIVLSNGVRYTLNGSGLKVPTRHIMIPKLTNGGADEIAGYSYIEATVTASGYTTPEAKKAVAALVSGTGCAFDWSKSPAINRAINAVQAGITDKQVEDWLTAANRQAWTDNTRVPYNKDEAAKINYNQVWLVPFLKVTVTDYKPNGSITMSMVPSYRIEVRKSADGIAPVGTYVVKANEGKFYSPNANGTALSLTTKDLTDGGDATKAVEVTFNLETAQTNFTHMHQDGTYVYAGTAKKFTITHAGNSGLGTVVINNTQAAITLYDKETKDNSLGTFDTLQAAVDASENNNYIEVSPGYKSTETISVTGKPRTIKIKTGTILTVSNASGGLVDVDQDGGDKVYTIKLNREVVTVTTASISVAANNNGTATASATSAKAGDVVTITVTPKAGFTANTPTVKTNTGASVSVSGSNGSYTFKVPAGATSITVTPNYVTATGLPFTDVPANSWYFKGVKYCWDTTRKGYHLMEGLTNDQFSPNGSFTRAQMVQIMYNIKGRPSVSGMTNPFTDVSSSKWYYDAIVWAANNGYADGYGNGRFYPENNVKRDELVEFLWKFAGKPTGLGNLNGYTDGSKVPLWAQNSMKWASGYSILSGQNSVGLNGVLGAESTAKRCEVAVTVMNFDSLALVR